MDLVTILPAAVQEIPGGSSGIGATLSKFIGIVRVLRAFRILRLYRLFEVKIILKKIINPRSIIKKRSQPDSRGSTTHESEVKRKIIIISCTIIAIVFIAAAIVFSLYNLDIGNLIFFYLNKKKNHIIND